MCAKTFQGLELDAADSAGGDVELLGDFASDQPILIKKGDDLRLAFGEDVRREAEENDVRLLERAGRILLGQYRLHPADTLSVEVDGRGSTNDIEPGDE